MPSKAELRQKWDSVDKDTVVLHMIQRSTIKPNGSPFVIKLETFMRMHNIAYVEDFEQPFGAKGKTPWITLNKEDVTDSQICLEHMTEKLGKDSDSKLTIEQKAIARSFRIMLEEHFYWCFVTLEFAINKGKYVGPTMGYMPVPGFLRGVFVSMISRTMKSQAHAQGTGRHSKEEVEKIGNGHLRALSDYLGDKPFFFGDDPTSLDVVVFSFVSGCVDIHEDDDLVFKKTILEELTNLKAHYDRMRERYWPDWEEKVYVDPKATKRQKETQDEKASKEEEDKTADKTDKEKSDK